jgi:DNA sulfur modification protein DndB
MTTFDNDANASSNKSVPENELFTNLVKQYLFTHYDDSKWYPALEFKQGKRTMLQINVRASFVPTLLKAKPSDAGKNDPYSGKNRPVKKEHAAKIKQYVLDRAKADKEWILGTLTANLADDPNNPKIIEIKRLGLGVCFVRIPLSVFLDITDGQHRTRAIQEIIMSQGNERDLISEDSFPITLVLEEDRRQCQTDFRDMAQTLPLPKPLLVSYGALGRDGITQHLVERVPMFQGKTQLVKPSPGSNTKFIYTSNYIAKAVSCAFANDPNDELLNSDSEVLAEILTECLTQFFSHCLDTKWIFEKTVNELTVEEVNTFKEECLLGVSVGLEILGRLLYYTYDSNNHCFDEVMVSKLAKLDWSRESNLWNGNVVSKDPNPKDPTKPYKITASGSAVNMAIKAAKLKLGWQREEQG